MFLLILLCTSVSCEYDMHAKSAYYSYSDCVEQREAVHREFNLTGFCVKDLPINPLWESFE